MAQLSTEMRRPSRVMRVKSDGDGLQLWIMPTGAKLWRLAYRYDGKQKLLAIGPYPTVSLVSARRKRDDARKLLADGKDPAHRRSSTRPRGHGQRQHLQRPRRRLSGEDEAQPARRATISKVDGCWTTLGIPSDNDRSAKSSPLRFWRSFSRSRPPGKWRRQPVSGKPSARCFGTPSRLCGQRPIRRRHCAGPSPRPKPSPRAAITDPVAFGGLLRAVDGFMGQPTTKAALQLATLLACRPVSCATRHGLSSIWKATCGAFRLSA